MIYIICIVHFNEYGNNMVNYNNNDNSNFAPYVVAQHQTAIQAHACLHARLRQRTCGSALTASPKKLADPLVTKAGR